MGTFINSLGSFINQYTNKCRKFAKVAKIVCVRVTTKVKISIFGDAANIPTTVYIMRLLMGFPLKFCNDSRARKTRMMLLPEREKATISTFI